MFNPFDYEDPDLDEAIKSIYADLRHHKADSEEYRDAAARLTELYALRNQMAQLNFQAQTEAVTQRRANADSQWEAERAELPFLKRIDPNTALTVAGNILLGIVVVKYEQTGVISSKVFSFMRKI